jgi:uncharacterized cupin superfamily protein
MPKLNLQDIPQTNATGYPLEHADAVKGRWYRRLAPVAGLTEFGASHVVLKPGAWSSQRHWHDGEDELVVMIAGEAVLVDDAGDHPMRPGDVAAFPKGEKNGHVLQNRSQADCVFVAISAGDRSHGGGYSDIDMMFTADAYIHKDGTPYPTTRIA